VLLPALLAGSVVQTDPDPNKVSPGFAGFVVVFLLAIATIVLIRSMTSQLRKVRFSPGPETPEAPPSELPASELPASELPASELPAPSPGEPRITS